MTSRFLSNPSPAAMPGTADMIVIGGGPAGAAALWAIERAAPGTRTVLIEQNGQLATGSSLASLENFRTCWAAPALHRMMSRSLDVFQRADEFFGEGGRAALGIKQQGYLFVAFDEAGARTLRVDVTHLHTCGLTHVDYLDAAEVAYRHPWLGERVLAAKFDPQAGWLDSNALVYQFVRAAPSATILLGVKDTRIRVEGGRVVGVSTANGDIDSPNVVIAAGAGSRALGRTAGIEIPIVLRPRQSFTTGARHAAFPEDSPCVISAAPFPHVRPEARSGAIFGWEYRWVNKTQSPPPGPLPATQGGRASKPLSRNWKGAWDEDYSDRTNALIDPLWPVEQFRDPRFPSLTLALLARQFGHRDGEGFADPCYMRGIAHRAGYYVYRDNAYTTADDGTRRPYDSQRAIIDRWPDIEGLFLSVGHVGHGIMSAPAAGEILASKVLNQPLPDATFADFGLDVSWVEHDAGGLSANGQD